MIRAMPDAQAEAILDHRPMEIVQETRPKSAPKTALVLFGTPYLYGQERAVIEIFSAVRPEIEALFLMSYTTSRFRLPVLREIEDRSLDHVFLPDKNHWPRIGWPRSLKHSWEMILALVKGNLCLLNNAKDKDCVYVSSVQGCAYAVLGALYCRLHGRRVIHHFHDLQNNRLLLRLWSLLVTDFVHNTKSSYATVARKHPYIRRKQNTIIPCVVGGRPNVLEDIDASSSLRGTRNIFFVGQVSLHKGIDHLVEAFKSIAASHPDTVLHIVGGCSEQFKEEFDRMLLEFQPASQIRYWGYREDVPSLLKFAYLYVQPSPPSRFNESFGRGVVEAMALGIPSVCYRSGALQELVVHEETGLVCDREDTSCLADAILRLLHDEAFRDLCGRRAREHYREHYSPDKLRARWLRFFGVTG